MMSSYSGLSRAQLSYEYLHTNSTTHEFLFGALAELVDNARDASATKISIYSVPDKSLRGDYMLCFLDDGEGMDSGEASDIITFGKSTKKTLDSQMIGMYGNGLKSGSMRIGNDFCLFTKKGAEMTCVFLSRTFHEQEKIDEVIVPIPIFDATTKKSIASTAQEKERHEMEMQLIYKYSPFKNEKDFMAQFDKIDGSTGTLVIVYNMKLLDSGEPELDVNSDANDILLSSNKFSEFDADEGLMPERRSFRAYTALLYVDPRMRIFIQGKKVRTKRLANTLYKPRLYKFSSSRFKSRAESETQKAKDASRIADAKAREAESKAKNLETQLEKSGKMTKAQTTELRKLQAAASELRADANFKKNMAERKAKTLKDPKILNFIFGVNLDNRNQDGVFVYNCSRLIKMYQKVGPQADGGVFCSGVVGIVDVPYLVLEPTHNKQDFADAKEYRHLLKALGEHMVQYWKDIGIAQQGVTTFWTNFGYVSSNWKDNPSQDSKFLKKRAMQMNITLQCDMCLKWRMLPFSASNIGKDFPDDWECTDNTDPQHNTCATAEQRLNINEGVLKKEIKSKEDKAKDLEEEIKKKQQELEKMANKQTVHSSRQAKKMEEEKQREKERQEEEQQRELERREKEKERERIRLKNEREKERMRIEKEKEKARMAKEREKQAREREREKARMEKERERQRLERERKKKAAQKSKSAKVTSSSTRGRGGAATKRKMDESSSEEESESSEEEEEEVKPSPAKRKPTPKPVPVKKKEVSEDEMDEDKDVSMETTDITDTMSEDEESEVGTKVEAKVNNKWHTGTVIRVNKKDNKWKVKFDSYPKDKYDKWYPVLGGDIKSLRTDKKKDTKPPGGASPSQDTAPKPSSSTTDSASGQLVEELAHGYRTCLRYFLPPQWVMDKDAVATLTVQELANFNLDDFFDHYEKGLRKLVNSFQSEASAKQTEADTAKSKLSNVRKLIAKLLKSINEEFDIDPNQDNDSVDELLATCVKQVEEQNTQS
ncbi:unnamed protein product [Owenia fusiformis]|uniref:Uncharacterized protein n=1 Tax=Owenia fusiformis TaxID=6347 RepID=A0A8J1UYG2_OWEFU|nr:unnamed protein product [Owenia fusiformis]